MWFRRERENSPLRLSSAAWFNALRLNVSAFLHSTQVKNDVIEVKKSLLTGSTLRFFCGDELDFTELVLEPFEDRASERNYLMGGIISMSITEYKGEC